MTLPSFTMYLARHGQTEFNRKRLMQGRSIDAELNDLGREQAEALATRTRDFSLDAVYSSPLKRALQTAEPIARNHQRTPSILPALAEMAWGDLEGQPIDELKAYLQRVGSDWSAGKFEHRVGGGESILDVESRAQVALAHIHRNHTAGSTVFVVTHGRFLRVLLATAVSSTTLQDMERFPHANTGLYRLDWNEGRCSVTLENCTSHLHIEAG